MAPPDKTLRLLACQLAIPAMKLARERDAHLALSARKVSAKLNKSPLDLVVLPELSSISYSRDTFDNLGALAETLDGASFQCWREVAVKFGCFIAYSFARRDGDNIYISLAVVGPDGTLAGHYDKIHLAQYGASMEKEYFSRGDKLFIFCVNGFKLAPIICYDIRFPELARTLAVDHGVELILHCGAYYRDQSFASWHAFATTRAIENQIFFLSLNRAGEHYGNSLFCWPWMDQQTPPQHFLAHEECFKLITLRRNTLNSVRNKYTLLKDRLDSYSLSSQEI